MKTTELLAAKEEELTSQLKEMKLKELEKHSQKLLNLLGGGRAHDKILNELIQWMPEQEVDTKEMYPQFQTKLKEMLTGSEGSTAYQNGIIEKLSVIQMLIIAKEYADILEQNQ